MKLGLGQLCFVPPLESLASGLSPWIEIWCQNEVLTWSQPWTLNESLKGILSLDQDWVLIGTREHLTEVWLSVFLDW